MPHHILPAARSAAHRSPSLGPSLAVALTVLAVVWSAAIILAPRVFRSPSWAPAASVVYAAASRICHQRPERSFHTAGFQWPVCARCAGLYLSATVGALLGWIGSGMGWRARARRWLLVAAVPTALTWSLEFAGVMPFTSLTRAVAAVPLGAVAGWVFVRMLRYDSRLDAREINSRRTSPSHG